ncbi:MAG: hypothetical protein R6V40_01500 [Candidatus Moraniibacteriota bacterium]
MKPIFYLGRGFERVDLSMILPGLAGIVASLLALILTLDILAALVVFALVLSGLIFHKSFSRGWLFLLGITLLFPSVGLNKTGLTLFDLLLSVLALFGMVQLAIKDKKVLRNKLTFYFFLIFLIALAGGIIGRFLNLTISKEVWQIALNLLMIWALLIGFQYFFQTQKRIKRFFFVIVLVAVAHSVFGIAVFFTDWETSIGMGVSSGKTHHPIFNQVNERVNGFLGIELQERTGVNPLAPFLCAGILSTVGFFLVDKEREKKLFGRKKRKLKERALISVLEKIKQVPYRIKKGKLFRKRMTWIGLAFIQFLALFLTFSYGSLIYLGIGFLVMGILIKRRQLISLATMYLIIAIIIIPSLTSSVGIVSVINASSWFEGFSQIGNKWIFGLGVESEGASVLADRFVRSSYLLMWSTYGILGIIIFLSMLWQYFIEIYRKYESTKNGERIWFITVVSIFAVLLLEGLSGNVIIFGPAAIIFWLMYGVILNLGKTKFNSRPKKVVYK